MTRKRNLKLLYSKEDIAQKVGDLADQISKDYYDKEVVLIGVLKGAFVFLADLARNIRIPLKIDFVRLSSYGEKSQSSGKITGTKDIELPIGGKHVIIVEDIVDTGFALSYLTDTLRRIGPDSLKTCVLIDKTGRRELDVEIDYGGFQLEEGFIVGYGLDWSENYRNLPEIYSVETLFEGSL